MGVAELALLPFEAVRDSAGAIVTLILVGWGAHWWFRRDSRRR
jgi:hypothetical protein